MRRWHLVALAIALGLLIVSIACDGGDDAPAATDTPAADAATGTVALDPTLIPGATATLSPDVARSCPIDNVEFCALGGALDAALQSGNSEAIFDITRRGSLICSEVVETGPCAGMNPRVGVVGYVVGSTRLTTSRSRPKRAI